MNRKNLLDHILIWACTFMCACGMIALIACAIVMNRPDLFAGVIMLLPVTLIFAFMAALAYE